MRHPAKYNDALLDVFRELLQPVKGGHVLDIFAGTGKIHQLREEWITTGIEIEAEWANMHRYTMQGDATELTFWSNHFDAICTSPTYGNRMADKYDGRDGSKRNTYRCALGKPLQDNNSGGMQWGKAYRVLHRAAYAEAVRVLKPGGLFVLNIKDHIRKGERVRVSTWHFKTLHSLGLRPLKLRRVKLSGNGFGANGSTRVPYEYVYLLQKKRGAIVNIFSRELLADLRRLDAEPEEPQQAEPVVIVAGMLPEPIGGFI